MYEKLRGVVLNTVRHNERTNIVHIYTDGNGLMAFAVTPGSTRSARARNALLMPLSLVDVEAQVRQAHEVCRLREVRRNYSLATIYSDPFKNAIALFISELLTHVMQEPERNVPLFDYIERSVILLEQMTGSVANFHICFLYHLGGFLGIQPNLEGYSAGYWFDMVDGVFKAGASGGHPHLKPDEARVIYLLSRMTFANMQHFRFNREQRNRVLDVIISYYRLHNASIGTLRSPDILRQLFV